MSMQETLAKEHLLVENAGPSSGIHPDFVKLGMRFPVRKELERYFLVYLQHLELIHA
jgi:hypothetical protein